MNRREFLGMGLGVAAVAAGGCRSRGDGCKPLCRSPLRFHLGMAGFTFKEYKTIDMLKAMERLDVHYLCVKNFHLPFEATDAEIRDFRRQCADHGVTPYGIGPVNSGTPDEVKKAFDFAKKLGVGVVVGVPFKHGATKKWADQEQNRELCEQISPLCDEYDIRFAIHNHGPDAPKCFPTGDAACEFVKDLSPRMGMCLDIGHNYRSGKDPATCIRTYADRLIDFHLKDITPHTTDIKADAKILGRGVLDLPGIVRALADVGYAGSCSIEYETNFKDNLVDLAECVGYFKALLKS